MKKHIGLLLRTVLLLSFTTPLALAQKPAATPAFDVATIRPSAPLDMAKLAADIQAGRMPKFGPHVDANRAQYSYMTLKDLVANAYKVKAYQVTGPAWMTTTRFDIVANMPEGSSKDDAPAMLQTLLKDRFKLVAHRETKEHPVLGLVVGKGGPKLKESPAAPEPIPDDAPLKQGEMKVDGPDGPIRVTRNADGSATMNMGAKGIITQRIDPQSQTMHLDSTTVTMDGFADMLTNVMQMGGSGSRQVVNMTDIKGNYQVSLDISLADIMAVARAQGFGGPGPGPGAGGADAGAAPVASDPSGGSTLYSSVEKLGLKLESRKANVEQLVVDSAEKAPTEN